MNQNTLPNINEKMCKKDYTRNSQLHKQGGTYHRLEIGQQIRN